MDEFPCPAPGQLQKAMEIRRLSRRIALSASWPAYLSIAIGFAMEAALLAANVVFGIGQREARWGQYATDAVVTLYFLIWWGTGRWKKTKGPGSRKRIHWHRQSFLGEAPWQWYVLAAAAATALTYLLFGGFHNPMWFADLLFWFSALGSLAEGVYDTNWDSFSLGVIFAFLAALGTPPAPMQSHSNEFCMFLAIVATLAEAGIAYLAREEWKELSGRLGLDAGGMELVGR